MKILDIIAKVKNLESKDIYVLLERRGVDIYHRPELFHSTNSAARIITDLNGYTSLFLRMRDGEDPDLEHFILWHELGHIEIEGKQTAPRSYSIDTYRKSDEADVNIFAFFGMIRSKDSISSYDLGSLHEKLGIPISISRFIMNRLSQDSEFMDYIGRK